MQHLLAIVTNPKWIFLNDESQTAKYLFAVRIDREVVVAAIGEEDTGKLFVVTAFISRELYLKKYKLLWTREDGTLTFQ